VRAIWWTWYTIWTSTISAGGRRYSCWCATSAAMRRQRKRRSVCRPATISRRVTDQFLTTRPENYKPAGYHGNNGYGWNRIVQFSVVSLWMNAIACARLTGDEYRVNRLVRLFDDFLPGGA